MPVNALLIKALLLLFQYYGDSFKVECPTGSGGEKNLFGGTGYLESTGGNLPDGCEGPTIGVWLRKSSRRTALEGLPAVL